MKKIWFPIHLVSLSSILLISCAHYPDVRPASDGPHSVIFRTESKGEGFQKAFSEAKDFCDDVHKQRAVHVSETSEYVGSMSESTYNTMKTASKVTSAIGVTGAVFGGKNEQKAGGVAAAGGGIADSALGLGYEYTLKFKCE